LRPWALRPQLKRDPLGGAYYDSAGPHSSYGEVPT